MSDSISYLKKRPNKENLASTEAFWQPLKRRPVCPALCLDSGLEFGGFKIQHQRVGMRYDVVGITLPRPDPSQK